jgi:hypothetical protein
MRGLPGFFFDDSGDDCLPSIVAVAEVEHSMVDAPNGFAKGV